MVLQGPEGLTCPITHDAQGAGAALGQSSCGVATKSGKTGFLQGRATAPLEPQRLRRVAGSPQDDSCIRSRNTSAETVFFRGLDLPSITGRIAP
ncbi:hypothetical protein PB2503_00572 [Parvularcula bermudensis HTCC2503]|uniref:Uncharacterized protein n=1 Tax=Parvularcula bermudensis (strain ATCC BAA-594 / HTCC2503 / KCTC 12087) TaxID=314260 RepID=E0TAY6_PARBH|nr:hypothetical protein PB2503_00572 [Parvularcula bermudensis HTCC2503]